MALIERRRSNTPTTHPRKRVCPGFIATRMTAPTREARADEIIARSPLGRFGDPLEIAEMVVWLCSDHASFVTGAAYRVDGGWTAN
jgi:NAD(P)-dependent dehydrogenase (short-subunit alcohol dehydrogenase family)